MPQSVIGSLRVNLGLDSAQFEQGARRAMSASDGMQNRFALMAKGVTAATAGLAAAVGGISALAVSSANAAREVQTFARLSNADAEVFQKWAFGAQSVGIEQDKLSDILKDVNDRVGDFIQTGGGPMADFFENVAPKVGVTAEQFQKLSGPEALQLYVSSLEKAGASQQEMTFYLEAMSSESTALLPLLASNGEEMARLGARAEELGVVMNKEAIASLEKARIALGESAAAWTGLGHTIGAAAAPALEAAAKASASVAASLQPLVQGLGEASQYFGQVAAVAGTAAALFGARLAVSVGTTYVAAAVAAVRQTVALEMALGATSRGAALASVGIKGLSTALRTLKGALVSTGIGALIVGAGEAVYWFGRLVAGAGGFGEALSLLGDLAGAVWRGIVDSAAAIPPGLKGVWNTVSAGFFTMVEGLQRGWLKFLVSLSKGLASVGADGASSQIAGFAEEVGRGLDETIEKVASFEAAAKSSTAEAASIVSDAFTGAREAWAALGDAVSRAEEDAASGVETPNGNGPTGAGIGGNGASDKSAREAQQAADAYERLKRSLDPMAGVMAEYAENQKVLNDALAAGKITSVDFAVGMAMVDEAHQKAIADLDGSTERLQAMQDGVAGFTDALFDNGASIADWAESALIEFAKVQAQFAILSALGLSTEGVNPSGTFIGKIIDGFRASGGPVSAGRAYVVGEEGPELMVPQTSGFVVPNHELKGGSQAAGGVQRLEVVVTGGDLVLSDGGQILAEVNVRVAQGAQATEAKMRADVRDGRGLARDLRNTTTAQQRLSPR